MTAENYDAVTSRQPGLTLSDFTPLEKQLGFELPKTFKAFYLTGLSLESTMDLGGIHLAGNTAGAGLSALSDYFFEHGLSAEILKHRLVPFGLYNDEWYICLDLRNPSPNPPISLFEMGNWEAGASAISSKHWFSTFDRFIRCMTSNDPQEYAAIDPYHNFYNAYDYWQ